MFLPVLQFNGIDGIHRILDLSFFLPLAPLQQLSALIIEPEGIDQKLVGLAHLVLGGLVVEASADLHGLLLPDQGNEFRLAGHRLRQDGIPHPHTVGPVGVASADPRLLVLVSQLQGPCIGLLRLAGVKCLEEVKPLDDLR